MPRIQISVRDFALPVPRTGSIETHSGFGRASAEGQEIHLRVQESRGKQDPGYQAEVRMMREFERDGYVFEVGGRIDGLFAAVPPRPAHIEEIKSAFNIHDLSRKLSDGLGTHPYCLQLKTYGYFHWLEHAELPRLSFHLVSTRNWETQDLDLILDVEAYERWLRARLDELVEEARRAEKRAARRRKIAERFAFPFANPRSGQVELMRSVEEGMAAGKRMLVQAPTGLGKTAGVLFPVLKESLARGQRTIYVTPKNSQHSVAEDAIERFQETGAGVKSLTITAKGKICFKNEPLCNPEYCEYARDYYEKVAKHGLIEKLARKRKLKAATFRDLGEEYQVCPFELQLDAARDAETVICDYNYVFAPRSAFGRISETAVGQEGKPNLVIDEAHNLLARAMDYYSPALSSLALERMREDVRQLPSRFRGEAEELLDACIQTIVGLRPAPPDPGAAGDAPRARHPRHAQTAKIDPPVEPFLEQESRLRAFLSRYLDSDIEIQPRDVVLRLCFYWAEFTGALGFVTDPAHTEFFTTFQSHPSGGTIKITCCDASQMLKDTYDEYEHVVGFSATLKPFEYYAKLSGLDPEAIRLAEFQSPFPRARRKLLIIPQISTKYADRERNYGKVAETIRRLAELKRGNYFAFFPSFEFLGRVAEIFQPPAGFGVIRQEREMRIKDVEAVLGHLREGAAPTIVFAVQGGVFSEGVDYPGEMVIGAFVVGPPLPSFDLEREEMRAYYEKHYGAGFDYAYTFPAMSKAVQAAGRVIRSETDRGLIVLMDSRFVQPSYARSMPGDWFDASARELVSGSILKEVADFWAGQEASPEGAGPDQPGRSG